MGIRILTPIVIGGIWVHQDEGVVCKVTDIWVDIDGDTIIQSEAQDEPETDTDNVADFLKNYIPEEAGK